MSDTSSKQVSKSSPRGTSKTRRRLPNGMGEPIMVRPQQEHRELVETQSKVLGVSMGLLAERLLAIGVRIYRQRGVDALDLPEVL